MEIGGIGRSQIDAMVAQLRTAAAKMEASATAPSAAASASDKPNFADALKASLDQVNQVQTDAQKISDKFAMGDEKISLADVMISMQKANISFQTAVQVRNKLVSAYHDIMTMQI